LGKEATLVRGTLPSAQFELFVLERLRRVNNSFTKIQWYWTDIQPGIERHCLIINQPSQLTEIDKHEKFGTEIAANQYYPTRPTGYSSNAENQLPEPWAR
jgi:hypothetical protein